MLSTIKPIELWTKQLNPSELYAMERRQNDNPFGGGGQLYIQVTQQQYPGLLKFLGAHQPSLGSTIPVQVHNPLIPNAPAQILEFWVKSQDRMRTGPLNRFRGSSIRPDGWSPASGFPTLPANQGTNQARALLNSLGGVRIFLARDAQGKVWAGFTQGAVSPADKALPYAKIAWAPSKGGYWP